jgi:hypothetical protein
MPDRVLGMRQTADCELPHQRNVLGESRYSGDNSILHESQNIPGCAIGVPFVQPEKRGEIDSETDPRPATARGGVSRVAAGRIGAFVVGALVTGRQLSLHDERHAVYSAELVPTTANEGTSVHTCSASVQTDSRSQGYQSANGHIAQG